MLSVCALGALALGGCLDATQPMPDKRIHRVRIQLSNFHWLTVDSLGATTGTLSAIAGHRATIVAELLDSVGDPALLPYRLAAYEFSVVGDSLNWVRAEPFSGTILPTAVGPQTIMIGAYNLEKGEFAFGPFPVQLTVIPDPGIRTP